MSNMDETIKLVIDERETARMNFGEDVYTIEKDGKPIGYITESTARQFYPEHF